MTKVLFISNDPGLFEEGSAVRTRMQAYAGLIGELHILARSRQDSLESIGPLTLHGRRISKLRSPIELAKRAHALILAHGIDVVSAQDPFEHGWAAMQAVRGTQAKLHVQVHTDFRSPWFVRSGNLRSPKVRMPLLNHVRRAIADRVLPEADGIRTVSKRVKESLMARYGARITEPSVIPIEVSAQVPDAVALPPHAFTFALIAVSRLEPEKRIEDLISALARIRMRYPSVGLFIVGEGSERAKLERMARMLGMNGCVVFLGARADARGLMRSAQAFIQASAYEGYGLTLIEAALSRVPIITTDVGIVGEVFSGYEEVLAAPPADPAALATHIMGLVEDLHYRTQLVMSAELAAKKHLESYGDLPQLIQEDLVRTLEKKG